MVNKEETLENINCPHCGKPIPINETVQKHVYKQVHAEFEADKLQQQKEMEERERLVAEKESSIERIVADRMKNEKTIVEREIQERIKGEVSGELEELKIRDADRAKKLQEASERERELIRQKQAAEDKAENATLQAMRLVDAERSKIKEEAVRQADDEHRLKEAESDRKIQDLLRANDKMKRKLQQGSQQMQGEVLELELEGALKNAFPSDIIEEVAKGVKGADVVQTIV